ncbi:sensor domain-containing diguanylate cyclase [Geodermatophilus sp. YIM 151500]|uniref:sensor domain-containing diguanylate cyclase n=1 Tax=Geodermatophilus sp. YIM 151500 TaxID=2984531 RepID=UPI0021E4DA8E|nr:sensor domain-containing diguanylate cyclase [Geodermatophilus sp. YIM 151500]MCV2490187.1 sensor domain-containing diguanylate cyclase [Geodermatophilus sp. YIM 151500]
MIAAEARETSGATTGVLLRYVRGQGGDEAVAAVLARAGVPWTPEELDDQSRWWSYDTRIRLFTAATEVLGSPDTMFRVGAAALESGLAHSLVILLRAMGSPRQVFRQLPRAVTKFSTTSTMEILDVGPTSAVIRYRLHEGYEHSRLDCIYAQGLISTVPVVFGLAPARIEHDECESDGAPACTYRLTWERRTRLPRRRRDRPAVDPELTALRGQLQTLQSAATDLVASDDLGTVLRRIVERAAQAVLAPAYLLAVSAPDGGPPLVHSAGLPEEEVPRLAATLLDGGDLGPGAVVVDVASARRAHGRLAALYRPGDGAMGDEASMLSAYAGHAAAALDLLIALEEARQEAQRAGALLSLAHELAAAVDEAAVCAVVSDALPRIVGCRRAGILLWDASSASLRSRANSGLDDRAVALLARSPIRAEDAPELVGMLTDRAPRILEAETSSPVIQGLLRAIGTADLVAVPLQAGGAFLGVATVGWEGGEAPASLGGDVLARLLGVADQASTALQKARLLETVRHQALHDPLTGLPNRVLFVERLERAVEQAGPDAHLAVFFCDLDLFKEVNDSLGHAAGDELLRQVAARLRAAVRPGDTVGRLSGDEFAIILPGLVEPTDVEGLVRRVTGCFDEAFRLEGTDVTVGTSVGVAVHGSGGDRSAEQLLREADAAMYRDKQRNRTPAAPADRPAD